MTDAWQDFSDASDQAPSRAPQEGASERDRLRAELLARIENVLFHLFPAGCVEKGKFYIGDIHGNPGDSMDVALDGPKIGLWSDFATGEGSDIFGLWAAARGLDTKRDFPKLIKEIADWIGTSPVAARRPKPSPKTPPTDDLGPYTAKWDYRNAKGDLIACVYRYDTPDGKEFRPWDVKSRKHQAPEPRPLYNQQGIAEASGIVLVEGEKCAEALIAQNVCATTAMNGANAPVDKTDWSPLQGKRVVIWPDNDEPGKAYAENVANYLSRLGIAVSIMAVPEGKPEGWDAADAIAEKFDVLPPLSATFATLSQRKPQTSPAPLATVPAYTVGAILDDDSPMPNDIIGPRILTPGGLLVFGGAPKVGKTDFILTLLIHMAAGLPFLGMKPCRPRKIFYLQAEIGYHYLRERLQHMRLSSEIIALVRENLVITPQVRLILDDKGVEMVRETILRFFNPRLLDVIAIDPLRNVFDAGDSGGENDNTAMLAFLQNRVEKLRFLVNPDAGIILAHHTRKITKKMLEEDPFQALSGAGSLRSFYTTGIIMFRPDEQQTMRELIFELRNGKAIPIKAIDKIDGHWCEIPHHSHRIVNKDYGEKLDNERRRRHDVILQILFDEGRKGKLYTPSQFCQAFENRAGLGGKHSIRDRIDVLATKGHIKFNRDKTAKSKYGLMCVEGMEIPFGDSAMDPETGEIIQAMERLLPTHFKQPKDGTILPVENPEIWVNQEEDEP